MTTFTKPNLIYGTASMGLGPNVAINTPSLALPLLDALKSHGITHLDTARIYGLTPEKPLGNTESFLAQLGVAEKGFTVDTKVLIGSLGAGRIRVSCEGSLKDLGVDKVRTLYLHGPDRATPLESICSDMNDLYREGKFEIFGVSNFKAEEVEEMIQICKTNNYVLPKIYEGAYSPLARHADTQLFPTLRRHNIAFYGYSTLAAGLLTGKFVQGREVEKGSRLDPARFSGSRDGDIYFRPKLFEAVELIKSHLALSATQGLTPAELATRWVAYHSSLSASHGDAIILGVKTADQLERTMEWLGRGPLGEEEVALMERVWEVGRGEAPDYCW